MNAIRTILILNFFLLLASGSLAVQSATAPGSAPTVLHARTETAGQPAGLEEALRQAAGREAEPSWVGYSVPMVAGMGKTCCLYDYKKKNDDTPCKLEEKNYGWSSDRHHPRTDQALNVYVRYAAGKVSEIQGYSPDCRLDLGGRRFVWLGAARPEQSVAFLQRLTDMPITNDGKHRAPGDQTLAVLALHRDAAADAALERLAAPAAPLKTRNSALFWIGQSRGERGARFLAKVIQDDRDDKVRDHAVFSLSQSDVPWAQATLLKIAQTDRSPHIRGQALFWLAQTDAPGAQKAVLDAIANDPATQVRKHGVFVLSQLKDGKATSALVQLAQQTRDTEVRKEAFFWLAQSKDPAALAYLDKTLND